MIQTAFRVVASRALETASPEPNDRLLLLDSLERLATEVGLTEDASLARDAAAALRAADSLQMQLAGILKREAAPR